MHQFTYILLLKYWALIFGSCKKWTVDRWTTVDSGVKGVDTARGCREEDYVINWITGPLESIKPFDAI